MPATPFVISPLLPLFGSGRGALLSIAMAGTRLRTLSTNCCNIMLFGASSMSRSFCSCRRANGVDLSIVRTLGIISVGILVILVDLPSCIANSQILACSPKLVLTACCMVLCNAASPTIPLQVYRLPVLSTPMMSSMGVVCTGGSGMGGGTAGTTATGSAGISLLGLINNAHAASASAATATTNKNTRISKSFF